MSTRLVIADDHALIRQGLRHALSADEAVEIVGEAGSAAEAAVVIDRERPDVVLIDVMLGDGNGLDVARTLRDRYPTLGIVILTMHGDDEHLFRALDNGASAFVLKSASSDEVLSAIKHARIAPTSFAAADLAGAMRRRMEKPKLSLTERETEVLDLLKEGLSVSAVAKRLYISESTAKTHIAKLYSKLDATNRAHAVMNAMRLGLIREEGTPAGRRP